MDPLFIEYFAQTGPEDFMAGLGELMEAYGVMNLSKETGIDRVTLWRFMRGDRLPRLDTFQKILAALGIRVQFRLENRMKGFHEYVRWKKQWKAEHATQPASEETSHNYKGSIL